MDLSTGYLGLTLRNPLVASASPLSNTVDGVRRLADGGVGAVVLYSRGFRRVPVLLPGRGRGGGDSGWQRG